MTDDTAAAVAAQLDGYRAELVAAHETIADLTARATNAERQVRETVAALDDAHEAIAALLADVGNLEVKIGTARAALA